MEYKPGETITRAYRPDTREYRTFAFDFTLPYEQSKDDLGSGYVVEGYATTFGKPYNMGTDEYPYFEVVDFGALDNADMSDVIFQLNHEGQTLARQRTKTLKLEIDDHGLKVTADLGGSQAGRNLYEAIKNGLIDRMSWGFTVKKDGFYFDEHTKTSHLTAIEKVFDVSAVSIPANQDTEIHARSYLYGVIKNAQQEVLERERNKRLKAACLIELQTL